MRATLNGLQPEAVPVAAATVVAEPPAPAAANVLVEPPAPADVLVEPPPANVLVEPPAPANVLVEPPPANVLVEPPAQRAAAVASITKAARGTTLEDADPVIVAGVPETLKLHPLEQTRSPASTDTPTHATSRPPAQRSTFRTALICVVVATSLGAVAAMAGLRTAPVTATARPTSAPPIVEAPAMAGPALAEPVLAPSNAPATPPAAPEAETHADAPPDARSCDALIAAHPAPGRKLDPFDYLYLVELRMARRELRRGNLEAAHAALCRSSRAPGADTNVWFELAQVSLMRGDGVAALPWLEKVLELAPRDRLARALLGDALIAAGRADEARAAWLKAARVRSDDDAGAKNLAAGYFKMAEQAAQRSDAIVAERFYQRATALDPSLERAPSALHSNSSRPNSPSGR